MIAAAVAAIIVIGFLMFAQLWWVGPVEFCPKCGVSVERGYRGRCPGWGDPEDETCTHDFYPEELKR